LVIYFGEPEEYFCFITNEAYDALKDWMVFRQNSGEEINEESWLMRDRWATTDFNSFKNSTLGLVNYPKKLKSSGIKSLIERAMRAQSLVKPLQKGVKRREWKSGHGYRKFFKTQAEQVMQAANVELLSGRTIGVSQSYYKPIEKVLLADYLKAIPMLTINHEYRLRAENKQLKEINNNTSDILERKLQEKDENMGLLTKKYERLDLTLQTVLVALENHGIADKNMIARELITKGIYKPGTNS
jgi:hypothetical protein